MRLERSSLGRVWESVTGQSVAQTMTLLSTSGDGVHLAEIHSLQAGVDQQEVMANSVLIATVTWREESSIYLGRAFLDAPQDPDGSFVDVRLAAGVVTSLTGESEAAFTALLLDLHGTNQGQFGPEFQGSLLLPVTAEKHVDAAVQVVDSAQSAQEQAGTSGTIGVAGVIAYTLICIGESFAEYLACRAEARVRYIRDLRDSGCWPPPEGFGP